MEDMDYGLQKEEGCRVLQLTITEINKMNVTVIVTEQKKNDFVN